ncbi:tigger transposable element-derived protein 1-like [Zeugodacus cucurbitae]|uniref:tigger transposable element-derived protein 1-like n=1 Tax=Zeugodacus cucurbitae TaxID=28588 RepID=UPI0023D8F03E|nr:tigger transposable element-derived protein 1-like [Zeugodacus cucurbitae]
MASKRRKLNLREKIKILDELKAGEKIATISKRRNIHEATIRTIRRNETTIRKVVAAASTGCFLSGFHVRDVAILKAEHALLCWIEDNAIKRIPIDTRCIKAKMQQFYMTIKNEEPSTSINSERSHFIASNGWLRNFLKRNSLHNVKVIGEGASADEHAGRAFPKEFLEAITLGGYEAHQVFNADETALFWKKMPSRTCVAKQEKSVKGFKVAKERITLLLCSNASGDKMLKPLLVNKNLNPRALKGIDKTKLPVHWMANKKAWVTASLFKDWFLNHFVPEVREYLRSKQLDFKVLLVIDNTPGHPDISHKNVKIMFLPPNTTSLIQPLDQGIIATLMRMMRTGKHIQTLLVLVHL